MAKSVKRLVFQFKPSHYKLSLIPDKSKMAFSGSVEITGQKTGKPSQRLTFHQKGLKIESAVIHSISKHGDRNVVVVDRINLQGSFNELRLHAKQMLYPGKYEVLINFSGKITDEMNGLYPSRFKYKAKQEILLGTQFESHHAREVFPCIDEPEAKATFDLSLLTPKNDVVVSNTPVEKVTEGSRGEGRGTSKKSLEPSTYNLTTFQTTPKMSTYLLAFVSGKMDYLESKTKRGVVVRTYATPDNAKFTQFALDFACKSLDFYEDYFGIDYPLEKCDLIALPDFASGAMENWGCITFREQALLVDPKNTSLSNKQYVAMVVAHELAHMWFGNLVTMRWWTDLWLNEGFASWIEYLAVDHIFPDWHMWTQFVVDEQQQALKLDALEHTHPVEVAINHPDEIRTIFDAISYSKGSSVIHMLHEYLGKDFFREGLSLYLKKHEYSNTVTEDLWKSLEEASGKKVAQFMHKWTGEPGFPLLRANIDDSGQIELTQTRFLANPLSKLDHRPNWPLPLQAGEHLPKLIDKHQAEFKADSVKQLKLNRGHSGFYRTVYNTSHLIHLGEAVREGKLSELDRLGILSDLFEAAKAGKADIIDALKFLENFANEDSYAVWDVISSGIGSIRLVMDDEDLREKMKPYILKLVSRQVKRLGWNKKDKDTHFDRLLRPIIFSLAASADDAAVVRKCKELFKAAHSAHDISADINAVPGQLKVRRAISIDPDMRGTVFGTVARLGGEAEFNKILKMHNSSTLSEERNTLAAALTNFKQPELVKKALAVVTTKNVRLQDVTYWIAYSFMNRHAKFITWGWLKDNWGWLKKNFANDLSFYRMPIYAARVFSNDEFKKEYIKFFEPKVTPALDRSYKQGLEILELQVEWKKRALKEVKNFFK